MFSGHTGANREGPLRVRFDSLGAPLGNDRCLREGDPKPCCRVDRFVLVRPVPKPSPGQVMQCPPPRPRPSSAPIMVTTSIPALRRRVLFGKGKSDRPAWFYSTEDELSPGAVRVGRFKAVFNLRGDDGQQTRRPRGQMSRRAASMRMRVKVSPRSASEQGLGRKRARNCASAPGAFLAKMTGARSR